MAKIYAANSSDVTEREKRNLQIVRKAAAQGIILLENDGVLPLTGGPGKLALYGNGARNTVKGGSGSGDVNSRTIVNVEQGLINAGYEITTKNWIDDLDEKLEKATKEFGLKVKEKLAKGIPFFDAIFSDAFIPPTGRMITLDDVKLSETDTAIYVLSRKSGEVADRYDVEGDYRLLESERELITFLAKSYEKFIILLNVGGVMDTSELLSIPGINAILLMSQCGAASGDSVTDVLTGKVIPSGKLTTTWAKKYADYSSSAEFSHNNGNLDDAYYSEGIYVGYRYFDTFNIAPAYPFGYGKSYTDFSIETKKVSADEKLVTLDIEVTNTGRLYAGKEVVQVYYSAPAGLLEKPYQELSAFAKTKLLQPGESERLTISFKLTDMVSYNEAIAAWVLEEGTYYVRVGNSSRNTKVEAAIVIVNTVVTQKLKNLYHADHNIELLSSKGREPYRYVNEEKEKKNAVKIEIETSKIEFTTAVYREYHETIPVNGKKEKLTLNDVKDGKVTLEELIGQLTILEMATLCVGTARGGWGGASVIGAASAAVPGAAGDTTSLMLEDRDIRNMILADGPAGLRLAPVFHATKEHEIINEMHLIMPGIETIMDEVPKPDVTNALEYYQYCTAIPIATLLAQTWDYELIKQVGNLVGEEMGIFGVTLWLAPGMNIHRNPLCGRNFEYYSEDPLISGMCAAADTEGVQSHPGVGTTIKHFAVNNQEGNRTFCNHHVQERTLREIYLKGFEIAVKKSQPMSIMSSYNLLNGTHTANHYDLLTATARDEWHFDGIVMTDWGTTDSIDMNGNPFQGKKYPCSSAALCIKAGNDLIMPGKQEDVDAIVAAVDAEEGMVPYRITLADLQFCTRNILKLIMQTASYEGAVDYTKAHVLESN